MKVIYPVSMDITQGSRIYKKIWKHFPSFYIKDDLRKSSIAWPEEGAFWNFSIHWMLQNREADKLWLPNNSINYLLYAWYFDTGSVYTSTLIQLLIQLLSCAPHGTNCVRVRSFTHSSCNCFSGVTFEKYTLPCTTTHLCRLRKNLEVRRSIFLYSTSYWRTGHSVNLWMRNLAGRRYYSLPQTVENASFSRSPKTFVIIDSTNKISLMPPSLWAHKTSTAGIILSCSGYSLAGL
jgi:hypothetical protein